MTTCGAACKWYWQFHKRKIVFRCYSLKLVDTQKLVDSLGKIIKIDRKSCFSIKKMISTSNRHAEHPFAGRNTQHLRAGQVARGPVCVQTFCLVVRWLHQYNTETGLVYLRIRYCLLSHEWYNVLRLYTRSCNYIHMFNQVQKTT